MSGKSDVIVYGQINNQQEHEKVILQRDPEGVVKKEGTVPSFFYAHAPSKPPPMIPANEKRKLWHIQQEF